MSALKPLAAAGKGNVAVILPDTVTSRGTPNSTRPT